MTTEQQTPAQERAYGEAVADWGRIDREVKRLRNQTERLRAAGEKLERRGR